MDLSQYIFTVNSGGIFIGQVFLADGYFITASHVIKDIPGCLTILNCKKYELLDVGPVFVGESDTFMMQIGRILLCTNM